MNQLNSTSNIPIGRSLETGRVERGSNSKQKFKEIDMEFDKYHISSVVLEMLPESRKPVELKNVKTKQSQLLSSDEVIELIKKLGELHSSGILTDDEFSEKKKELLLKL
jgi:DNA helicase HerA-like ATPase